MADDFAGAAAAASEIPHRETGVTPLYGRDEKLRAAVAYLAWADKEDSVGAVAKYAGISPDVLREWMNSEWWQGALELARFRQGEKLDSRLSEIINRATTELLDRIEHGDERLTKDGEIFRVKMGGKDLAVVAALALDKRQIIRGQPTAISRNESELSSIADKLKKIGMQRAEKPAGLTMEGEVVEVAK